MYFFACILNKLFLADFYRFQTVGLAQNLWTIANIFLLVSKCSWSFPNRSVLIFLSFSSSLLIVLFLILL